MSLFLYMIFGLVSILASMAGAICGIGGGVLIKPVLDAFGVLDVDSISFLSGCTVLAMSLYSIVKAKFGGNSLVNAKTGTPLAVGAALGGLLGRLWVRRWWLWSWGGDPFAGCLVSAANKLSERIRDNWYE